MTETKTHDDVINEEIEQEHAERKKERNIEVIQMSDEECQEMDKNLKDPNLFAMEAALTISAVDFVDMSECNSQKFSPLEIDEKRKQYIQDQLTEKLYAAAECMKNEMKSRGFIPIHITCKAERFEPDKYAAKTALMNMLYDLERD